MKNTLVTLVVFITALACAACSSYTTKGEYEKLAKELPANNVSDAEEAYDRVEKLATQVARLKTPPEGLKGKIRVLQQERARRFEELAKSERAILSGPSVLKALFKSGLTPIIGGFSSNPSNPASGDPITGKPQKPIDPYSESTRMPEGWK